MRSRLDLIGRSGQDELLSIRNDLMTVYREISADDDRLFPLRYARAIPRRPDSARGRGAPSEGTGAGAGGPRRGPEAGAAPPVPGLGVPGGPRPAPVRPLHPPPRRPAPARGRGAPSEGTGAGAGGRRRGPEAVAAPQVPVLVSPGGPGTASVLPFDPLRRSLAARGLDVLMMEHRGVGLSRLDAEGHDLPREAMRVREVVADLVAVLDHARVDRVAVYGSDYGAYLAQALAALHPERVHSLVLDSPLTSAEDEKIGQQSFREAYWDGTVPATSSTAAVLRRLTEEGVVEAHRAGPVVLAVHDHGGPAAVRDLVDLLVLGRGQLTWNSVRQVLTQGWLQSTPYVIEHDLVSSISHTELGRGRYADGGPLDPLALAGEQSRGVPAFHGEDLDLHALSRTITAPTLVISGALDLISPPPIARDLTMRIPDARLLEISGAGHSMLDSRSQIAQIAAWWSACGTSHLLPGFASRLAGLPPTATDQTVTRGLRLALAAERYSPWRLWIESARTKRGQAQVDPTARRTRKVRID